MSGKVNHDLMCPRCSSVEHDRSVLRSTIKDGGTQEVCTCCEYVGMQIYFGHWDDVQVFNDGMGGLYGYQRADKKGRVREFGVADDTLSKIQLGMYTKPTDKGLRNFTDDQTANYRERLAMEGDSGKLRKEIIETYESNKKKGL